MSSLNEVVLQVQTQLQEDWVAEEPVTVPGVGTGLAVTVDNAGLVQCYYISQNTVFNAYQRPLADGNSSPSWAVEDTHFPPTFKPTSVRATYVEGIMGDLCVACASDGNIYILRTAPRYPFWEKIPNTTGHAAVDAVPIVTLTGELRISATVSVNDVYVVNPTTYVWSLDRSVSSVTTAVRDLKVDRAYASAQNKSTWGYLLSGDGVTKEGNSGIVTVTAQAQIPIRRVIAAGKFSSLAQTPLTTTNATPLIFAIDNQTQVATYFQATGSNTFTPVSLFGATKVQRLDACLRSGVTPNDVQTEWVEVFAIDLQGNLLHIESVPDPISAPNTVVDDNTSIYPLPNGDFAVRKWSDSAVLSSAIKGFGLSSAGDGYAFLVALSNDLGPSLPSLIHYAQDPATTEWESDRIELPSGTVGPAIKKSVYYVEVSVFDTNNVRMPYMTALINAIQFCTINVNGVSTTIDQVRSFSTVANATGKISFVVDAPNTLSAPTFTIWVEGMAQGHVTDIQSSGDIQAKFRTITADQLKNDAIDQVTKEPLFANLKPDVLQDVATSLNSVMEVLDPQTEASIPEVLSSEEAAQLRSLSRRYIHRNTPRHLAHTRRRLDRSLGHIRGNSGRGFHLVFRPKLSVSRMTAEEAQKLIDRQKALGGFPSLNISWGDLFRGVKNGVIQIFKATAAAITDKVNAFIELVKDGIKYVWNGVVSFVRQAFDVAMGIFESVGVFFQKIFNWLFYLLNWGDIKHTAQVFEGMFTTVIKNGQNFFDVVIPAKSQEFFSHAKAWLTQNFDSADRFMNNFLVGTYDKDGRSSGISAFAGEGQGLLDSLPSTATWLLNKFFNTDGGGSDALQITGLSNFLDAWTAFSDKLDLSIAGKDLRAALDDLSVFFAGLRDRSTVDKSPISAILSACKNILFLIIDIFQLLVQGFSIMASQVLGLLDQFLNATLDIPVLSSIFQAITGEKLILRKVVTIIVAIPFTIAYKLISGETPFKNVTQDAVGATDLSKTPADDINLSRGILYCLYTFPDLYQDFVGANGSVTGKYIDKIPRPGQDANGLRALINGVSFFFVAAQLGLSSYPPPTGRGYLTWGLQIVNVSFQFGFLISNGFVKGPRGTPPGSITLSLIGLAQLGPAIWHAVEPEDNSGKTNAIIVSEFLAPLSEMAKFLAIWKNPYTYAALFVCDAVSDIGAGTARIVAYSLATNIEANSMLKISNVDRANSQTRVLEKNEL